METYEVTVIDQLSKVEEPLTVEVETAGEGGGVSIRASLLGREVTGVADAPYPAFQAFRDEILKMGFGLQCCGARANAVQPDELLGSDRVALVRPGKKELMGEPVSMWEPAKMDVFPATIHQQGFSKRWREMEPV
ncbi:MAG: hypothetical protein IJF59_03070 [Clostridia bacterium]|nr:hypothetical protein [Clostridia bacterium]MBQ3076252.1 hypothetical protein [Clostridia bacterium]